MARTLFRLSDISIPVENEDPYARDTNILMAQTYGTYENLLDGFLRFRSAQEEGILLRTASLDFIDFSLGQSL